MGMAVVIRYGISMTISFNGEWEGIFYCFQQQQKKTGVGGPGGRGESKLAGKYPHAYQSLACATAINTKNPSRGVAV